MAIQFHPKAGMVLICNYETGFQPPEMVKLRRVIVISANDHNKHGLSTVIPISTTPPLREESFHVRFEVGNYPFLSQHTPCWAKCNMVNTVSHKRLDRLRYKGQYITPSISHADLRRIHRAHLAIYDNIS